jgi:hypothetical protein
MAGAVIFNARQEPQGLEPDAAPIADYGSTGMMKDDAERGSAKLLAALMGLSSPKARRLTRFKNDYRHYTWEVRKRHSAQIARLQHIVADHFGVPAAVMTQKRGPQPIVEKRQVAMYLAREVVGASYPDIARCFGGRDHTTVLHACDAVLGRFELAKDLAELRKALTK